MKGIVLAGGAGSRLDPITRVASKQLQPVYDKPMVYYPLATLVEAGINEILVISTPDDTPRFQQLLGDGDRWGLRLDYAVQERPAGIAQAFLVGKDFVADDSVALILGDNIFYGNMGLDAVVDDFGGGAVVFGYEVVDPKRYGVVELDDSGAPVSLEEKPEHPRSSLAVPGFYIYDSDVVSITEQLTPSARGELEITDVNRAYLARGDLRVIALGRGIAWLDSGTHDSLLEAANFIATIERRQGVKIACLEEIAYQKGFIDRDMLAHLVADLPESGYRDYLERRHRPVMKAVIGGTGQLGAAFCRLLGAGALPLSRSQLDLSAIDSIEPAIAGLEVDTVINCAGYTAVDRAEAEADAAMAINSAAVGELARVCDSLGKRFVTFSTDYVFDGVKTSPYVESDVPNPLSVYGHTKLAGERLALAVNPETLVVRASWLLSGTHANFAATMLRLIAAGEVRVVDDQVGHPTLVDDLAPAVMACIEAGVTGVLHRTNQGTASWFQLARECAEIAALDVSRVVPCATEDLPRPAVRPSNSVLDSERATDVARLPHYRPGLERAIAQLLAR